MWRQAIRTLALDSNRRAPFVAVVDDRRHDSSDGPVRMLSINGVRTTSCACRMHEAVNGQKAIFTRLNFATFDRPLSRLKRTGITRTSRHLREVIRIRQTN